MSVIYLIHPEHGAKVAISDAEANYDEARGWARYNPDTPKPAADAPTDAPAATVANALAAPRRRGRTRQQQEP